MSTAGSTIPIYYKNTVVENIINCGLKITKHITIWLFHIANWKIPDFYDGL